ncbi:MAG: hypothetical protein RIT43_1663, partial [Bacteroidota bacterium]
MKSNCLLNFSNFIKICAICSAFLIFGETVQAQVYLLNEDFSSATGSNPPKGWNNLIVKGEATDLWRFNNPGSRSSAYPFIGNFAIFDSENYSGPGGAEQISLETPFIDCSFSPYIILYFDHFFLADRNGKATLEVFNGSSWTKKKIYTSSTSGIVSEKIDLSSLIGNVRDAKIRFTWEGDSSKYWMLDNIKLLAPLVRDANLKEFDSPKMPFSTGVNPVKVSLRNDGYQDIKTVKIRWTVNGVEQT